MTEFLNIGPTPYDEPCVQVGSENYESLSRRECQIFADQCLRELRKQFGESLAVAVRSKLFPHDFGSYREVVVYYDPYSSESVEQAFWIESADIAEWDEQAKSDLAEIPNYQPR